MKLMNLLRDAARGAPAAAVAHLGRWAIMNEVAARIIGYVKSPLQSRSSAPKQGDEGSPLAQLMFDSAVKDALSSIREGDRLILLTWLNQANRSLLRVHPRDDTTRPLTGVFSTRSQDRPNPIGLHRIVVRRIIDPLHFEVSDLEALDGTPIIDMKATLEDQIR